MNLNILFFCYDIWFDSLFWFIDKLKQLKDIIIINNMIGCIYKITLGDLGFYIGSAKDFDKRLIQHNKDTKTSNVKLYKAIRENDGKFVMTKLHDFEYENDVELRIEERRVYDTLSPNLNTNRPHITKEEWKEYQRQYKKQYNIDNADKIRERQRRYNIDNADKIREKQKQYNDVNADKIKKLRKKYNIDNDDKIKEKQRQLITCVCGCEITKCGLSQHKKTQKHINMMIGK